MAIRLLPGSYNIAEGAQYGQMNEQPSKTYALDLQAGRIYNRKEHHVDGSEAMRQAIFKQLATFQGWHDIYNYKYGLEAEGIIGESWNVALGRAARRMQSAILADARVLSVNKIEFKRVSMALGEFEVYIHVTTRFGDIDYETTIYPWSGKERPHGDA